MTIMADTEVFFSHNFHELNLLKLYGTLDFIFLLVCKLFLFIARSSSMKAVGYRCCLQVAKAGVSILTAKTHYILKQVPTFKKACFHFNLSCHHHPFLVLS